MYHPPKKEFLYAAHKISIIFSDGIKDIRGFGTCFIIDIGTSIPYIITNRHVIDKTYRQISHKYNLFKPMSIQIEGRNSEDKKYQIDINPNAQVYYHSNYNNDVAVILPVDMGNQTSRFHFHFDLGHLPTENLLNQIVPSDVVCFSGFPNTHDKLMDRPIMRCGTIASDPRFSYSWNKENNGDCIAYEGFSSDGASGSPVLALARGFIGHQVDARPGCLIGINAGHVPGELGHSGISYFYKATILLDIISENMLMHKSFNGAFF